jgi:ribosomal protein S21
MEFLVEHDNVTRALKVFARFLQKNKISLRIRNKQYYKKPSEIRIQKEKESIKRIKKAKRLARKFAS